MLSIPLFYFPTTVVCIDDDESLLKSLQLTIGSPFKIKCFEKPKEALNYLNNYQSPLSKLSFLRGFSEHEYSDTDKNVPVNMNLENIINLQNQSRFSELSLLVVDYDMPDMNGSEVLEELEDLPVKKILFTGNAGYDVATTSFNKSHIDRYITKGTDEILCELRTHINQLTKEFFVEKTSHLLKYIEADNKLPVTDKAFIRFFDEFIRENDIQEYYLIDKNGSFLLINEDGEQSYLLIHTEDSLNKFTELYEDDELLKEYTKQISHRNKIPSFTCADLNPNSVSPSEWSKYLVEPKTIIGEQKYYWSWINTNNQPSYAIN